jgi:DnaD/phage-associated family protein
MNYITITTEKNETYSSISNFFIDYYMTSANGDFVKVYLYLVRLLSFKEPISVASIADHFNLTENDICRAIRYWVGQDVLKLNYNEKGKLSGITLLPLHEKREDKISSIDSLSLLNKDFHAEISASDNSAQGDKAMTDASKPLEKTAQSDAGSGSDASSISQDFSADKAKDNKPAVIVPQKPVASPELLNKFQGDEAFRDLLFEAETYFNKPLSQEDTMTLVYIHDQLHFSVDLMEYLIEYCATLQRYSFRYAEKVAIAWYQQGIDTVKKAKAAALAYDPIHRKILKELGISRQKTTRTENAYIDSWTKDMGYDSDVILYACQIAILRRPQDVNFSYVNGILDNWHKNGVKSLKDAEASQQAFQKNRADKIASSFEIVNPNGFAAYKQADSSKELSDLEKLLSDELNGGLRKTGN